MCNTQNPELHQRISFGGVCLIWTAHGPYLDCKDLEELSSNLNSATA